MALRLFASFRNWFFPEDAPEAAVSHPHAEKDEAFRQLSASLPRDDGLPKEWQRILAEVATGLWRLRRRLLDPATGQPKEEMRRAYRDLESTWDVLAQAGVEILDHTGERIDPGTSIKCVAFQPTPGLGCEQVIETIKPTIYLQGQWIQMGEVIVGTPEETPETAALDNPSTARREPEQTPSDCEAAPQAASAIGIGTIAVELPLDSRPAEERNDITADSSLAAKADVGSSTAGDVEPLR